MARRARSAVIRHLPEIGVTMISKWLYNCYVVHDGGDGRPFVVDLGMPSQVPLVEAELRTLDADLRDLSGAVATHGHADHVGGLPELRARAGTHVHLPTAIAEMRAGTRAVRPPGLRAIAQILPVMASQPTDLAATFEIGRTMKVIGWDRKGVRLPFEPESWLADGDRLPGLPDWQVLNTPGHSDDSTCLYRPSTRTLISGDAVLSVEGLAWFNPEFVDGRMSVATESRLRALDVEHLLPGHGLVVEGPSVMDRALSFSERPTDRSKLRALVRVLRDHAGRQAASAGAVDPVAPG
ncbi:MBL fold metallo-hydrolase [Dermatobacter hominis]|uniref:MBL fold metallo-hydrolase n=1 Tax=Dermatobacter hominis TaxID=2884263 RepID=UPI001D12A064|nr:MBL fold metallo-hydrolase [Dermatobacter hominis]UDY35229.1 MBL fold metallo-hydrolase [Dermatobacter hominis]